MTFYTSAAYQFWEDLSGQKNSVQHITMVSVGDCDDSDEAETTPVAHIIEKRDSLSNMCSEASYSNSSWLPIRSHFIGMGYNALVVDKAIQEVGSVIENEILEYIRSNQECSCDSDWCSIKRDFLSMGFSSTIVDKALEECGTGDEALILDFLTNYKGSSCESSSSSIRNHFMLMGFSSDIVDKAIKEHGTEDEDGIFKSILTYELNLKKALLKKSSSDNENLLTQSEILMSEVIDTDDEDIGQSNEEINLKACLLEMGYAGEEVSLAIERYVKFLLKPPTRRREPPLSLRGDRNLMRCCLKSQFCIDIPIDILIDSIDALRHSEAIRNGDMGDPYNDFTLKEEGLNESLKNVQQNKIHKNMHLEDRNETHHKKPFQKIELKESAPLKGLPVKDINFHLSHHVKELVGFGAPGHPVNRRLKLKKFVQGPPYFYFENVYNTPKGVWAKISRYLHNVEPEFVDSKYFSVSSRKRGYVHNLPIDNRFQILPLPPMTIEEAFPQHQKYWPSWDKRIKLNCLKTEAARISLCDRLRNIVKLSNGEPTSEEQVIVLSQCKKWNLVWVSPDQLAPLEPHEMERVLGYDLGHTRCCSSRAERLRSLGNAFQVETIGYHLSVLKSFYPKGINVLSLFSGIGGAEVALHRLGIVLNYVVSAEIRKQNRLILRSWWEKTHQKGKLIEVGDVRNLTAERLDEMINSIGGFDLIIGGSPCNNLSGNNRCTRHGLDGNQSSIFYEFPRILNYVRGVQCTQA